jgi:hypothetical protein
MQNGNTQKQRTTKDYESMSIGELRYLLKKRGSNNNGVDETKDQLIAEARRLDSVDYDEEARKILFDQHQHQFHEPSSQHEREVNNNKDCCTRRRYSHLDAIWNHPTSGGVVYVGNYMAAMNLDTLRKHNIKAIVNCQGEESQNHFEEDSTDITYHRFVVSRLARDVVYPSGLVADQTTTTTTTTTTALAGGFQETFDFIQHYLDKGQSVLIHCLAGAHRAGAVGTAWIMYRTQKSVSESLKIAKECRPIISPFGPLLEVLYFLENELQQSDSCNEQLGSNTDTTTRLRSTFDGRDGGDRIL